MGNSTISIVATVLSGIIFGLLLNGFNNNILGIFVPMQRDLAKISKVNRVILYFVGQILSVSITIIFVLRFEFSNIVYGAFLGFLIALVNVCFENKKVKDTTIKYVE
ncbi:hypothetical protein [Clostridium sp.]|uniref:hypothetical protein n=1 Tax=Clostridium sp. TaxID=1506 RepID=UPI003F326628